MKRLLVHASFSPALVTVLCILLALAGCTAPAPAGEGFAIYLTRDDIPPSQMEALSHVDIAEQPVIALADVVSYERNSHEIILTSEAYERVTKLEVPVRGKSFVVCVDKQPVYWGAFWTPVSSISFDGIAIMKPLSMRDPKVIVLYPGYPSSVFRKPVPDPRPDDRVMQSLEQAGKLITRTPTPLAKLPHSMKGYELYSWQQADEWHFALMTGTNRNKTLEEIVAQDRTVSEDGWVHIHVAGIDSIKNTLARVPEKEEVFWLAVPWAEGTVTGVSFGLPPGTMVDDISEQARQSGFNLRI